MQEMITALYALNVFTDSMEAETFESRQLSHTIFYYKWKEGG